MSSGIYDQLTQLNNQPLPKTSSVGTSEASKTVETPASSQAPSPIKKQPAKRPTQPNSHSAISTPTQSYENPDGRTRARPSGRQSVAPTTPTGVRAYRRTQRRTVVRYAFEFYQDQVDTLRQVSLQAKLAGDDLSMSEMVREALDEYITHKNLRPDDRT